MARFFAGAQNDIAVNIYRENILDHYRKPRNFGRLKNPSAEIDHSNPACGDRLHLELRVEDSVISDIKFEGQGCAISLAAASILTEELKGQPVSKFQAYTDERMQEELGIPLSPTRLKCGLLALSGFRKLAKSYTKA